MLHVCICKLFAFLYCAAFVKMRSFAYLWRGRVTDVVFSDHGTDVFNSLNHFITEEQRELVVLRVTLQPKHPHL